jgi:hypothetical protein
VGNSGVTNATAGARRAYYMDSGRMVKQTPLSWCDGSVYSKAPPTTTVRDTQRHPMDATVTGILLSRYATRYTTAIYHAAHYQITSHGVRAGGENGIGFHIHTHIYIIYIHIYLPTPTTHRIFPAPISESEGTTTPQPILFLIPLTVHFVLSIYQNGVQAVRCAAMAGSGGGCS